MGYGQYRSTSVTRVTRWGPCASKSAEGQPLSAQFVYDKCATRQVKEVHAV